ncbi:hypothetical protein [Corynebacterium camporealensis]
MGTPNYMDNVSPLIADEGVEVKNAPKLVEDQKGRAKTAAAFPGLSGYKLPVEVVRGSREKRMPNGDVMEVLETKTVNVTVWAPAPPTVSEGDYVVFKDLMVGAVESSLFYQALGVVAVGSK